MRVLLYLAEIALAIAVGVVGVRAVAGALRQRREGRAAVEAKWKRRIVPLEDGRVRIEVAKAGVDKPIPVQTLNPQRDDFELARYEAEARADDLALSLNATEDE